MKKIIDRKVYDTGKATEVVNWNNGLGVSDFRNCDESLYRTKSGNYFLYGEGGAMTRWSETNGNTSWGSTGIEALTPQEALDWIERHDLDIPEGCPELEALVSEA